MNAVWKVMEGPSESTLNDGQVPPSICSIRSVWEDGKYTCRVKAQHFFPMFTAVVDTPRPDGRSDRSESTHDQSVCSHHIN